MNVLSEPILRGDSLSEQVLQRVSEAILSGELAAGTKIKEAELARKLGISRGPLREAMGGSRRSISSNATERRCGSPSSALKISTRSTWSAR